MSDLATLAGAVLLAAIGGEAFLKSILCVSGWLRVPKLLVATTLATFATSSPALTVSTVPALAEKPEIGLISRRRSMALLGTYASFVAASLALAQAT